VTILAAYLQAHSWRWSAFLHLTPWLNIAATEAPTIIGLALVPAVTLAIWALIRRRRQRLGLPPDTAISDAQPREVVASASSGRHPQP
jgi:uncharacterized iron-regulated membrane protein